MVVVATGVRQASAQRPASQQIKPSLARLARSGRFSGVALVAKDGRPILRSVYGQANRTAGKRNRMTTQFNLASMGKMFTGVAVAQLVQAGKVRFQDPVGRYVPSLPKRIGDRVTVGELLDHTSGLGDYFQDPGYQRLRRRLTSLRSYLPLISRERLAFAPGTRFSYSNSGFILAGLVVERASGRDYYSYVRDHVWRRAGMRSTACLAVHATSPRRAIGYTAGGLPNTSTLPPRGTSAGGCYSTAPDMLRFAEALVRHRLLNAALTRAVTTAHIPAPGGGYGYGFGIRTRAGRPPTIWHNGGSPGVAGELDIAPRLGYTVVVLENRDPDSLAATMRLIRAALRIA